MSKWSVAFWAVVVLFFLWLIRPFLEIAAEKVKD